MQNNSNHKISNLPLPEFRHISEGLMVTVFAGKKEKVGKNITEKRIVEKLKNSPNITKLYTLHFSL